MQNGLTRNARLIKLLPKHKTAQDALIEAGFSKSVATTQAKRTLRNALKQQAKEILNNSSNETTSKKLMSDIVGITHQELMDSLKFIATQERDLASALKVLAPLSKEHGVTLSTEEAQSVTVPILNVVVKQNETEAPHTEQEVKEIHGSVEPL